MWYILPHRGGIESYREIKANKVPHSVRNMGYDWLRFNWRPINKRVRKRDNVGNVTPKYDTRTPWPITEFPKLKRPEARQDAVP